ncbi:MAG: hypothetical protein GHCLOJNM_00876 [bacterium]|nr:hypothetical protein [bacterium]
MPLQFLDPRAFLLLLPLLPFLVWRWTLLRDLGPARRWIALALRVLTGLLLVLAMAQTQVVRSTETLSVLFAIDLSESVPSEQREEARGVVQGALERMEKNDQAGVVVFGKEAVLDTPVQPFLVWDQPNSLFDDAGSNLAAGLRLSLASLPTESQKRIVLFSDGNENRGSALEEAERLAGLGIPVDVFPLEYRNESEVFVEKLVHKTQVHAEEPLSIDVFVVSRSATPAKLRLLLDEDLILEQPVRLQAGKNKFTVPSLKIPGRNFFRLEARVEAEADSTPENNRAGGYVNVEGVPAVLLVEGDLPTDPAAGEEFVSQIQSEGISVRRIIPSELTPDQSQLMAYDSVVLSNVNASDLSQEAMEMLERGVFALGVGLVMVGGAQSFGAGGYRDTPVEKALPVSMEIKERKIIPIGALALVLHTCEILDGNNWMRQIAIEALRVLDPQDEVGMLDYEGMGVSWIFPMGPKGDGRRQAALIKGARPGDMPDFETAMKLGFNGLMTASSVLKHMVILSDGDPSPPSDGLINQFASNGITVTTVLIGGHGMNFRDVMSGIASRTGGRFYEVTSPQRLPKIFAREAARVKRNLIVEQPFQPNMVAESELTESFSPGEFPTLLGYVITTPKPGADLPLLTHQEDPLLAHWRHGVGKSMAFASDFKPKWAPEWIEWEGYGRFWAQAMRWVSKRKLEGDYRVSVHQAEGKGLVKVEAFDEAGRPVNYLTFEGTVLAPDSRSVPLRLVQTELGTYEGKFDVETEGTYLVNLQKSASGEEDTAILTTGLSVPYSPEFSNDQANPRLLRKIADVTGGRYAPSLASIFEHSTRAHSKPFPLWPWLLGTAVILFWLDVFTRRVLLEWADIRSGWNSFLVAFQPKPAIEAERTLDRLKQTKEAVLPKPSAQVREGSPAFPRFDFHGLEGRQSTEVDLSKPEGRKAAPQKREAPLDRGEETPGPVATRTTSKLLDMKRKRQR